MEHPRCFFPGCNKDPGRVTVEIARTPDSADHDTFFACPTHLDLIVKVDLLERLEQARPSKIVERPPSDRHVDECTVAELLTEVIVRASGRRTEYSDVLTGGPVDGPAVRRELSLAITYAEEALTRHNKAVYMCRGIFAITDAEQSA
jgi:hypothetical protein